MTDLIVGDATPGAPHHTVRSKPRSIAAPGSSRPDRRRGEAGDDNRLALFAPAILAVRWATTGVSIVLASPELLSAEPLVLTWVVLILVNTVYRTVRPLRYTGSAWTTAFLVAEIGLHVLAVVTTGYWESSLVLLMINAVIVAGFARGFGFAIRVGVLSTLAVTVAGMRSAAWDTEHATQAAQWTTLLLSGGVIAGYTRRISGEANRRHSIALDRVARLADANALLTDLHRVAQTLPASLDLADVLDSTLARLKGLIDHDVAFILSREEADGTWTVATQRGLGIAGELDPARMPRALRQAARQRKLVRLPAGADNGSALGAKSNAGMYVPLFARGRLVGLLGVESRTADHFGDRDEQIMRGFVEPVALAIDNARWFSRIRNVAAAEERTRIARDLHDRIGQSLAYLGVEIDRMIRLDDAAEPNGDNLRKLREDLRDVIGEVRDTLSDLRTDVTDTKGFAQTAEDFAARVAERSALRITLDCDVERRLPILQEREMWRIAQEALVNVERHAGATDAWVRWSWRDGGTLLEVVDNGQGLTARSADGRLGRADSYGIVGMRERADSVGATFELTSKPGEGTTIRCFLPQT
ncbi:MAG: GAF domain-containing sensor histidine kinase [Acidimicrobiia bacterium]|nr:GAF domain-containing sensor histidine kinase [Acidimicrobiia bacterium]